MGADAKLTSNCTWCPADGGGLFLKMLCSASLLVQPITAVFCFVLLFTVGEKGQGVPLLSSLTELDSSVITLSSFVFVALVM